MSIEKNSNGSEGGGRGIADTTTAAAVNESGQSLAIPWLPVMVGDVFEFYVLQTSSVSLNYGSGESGFAGVPTVMIEYLTNGKPITIPQLDQKSGTTFSGASSFTLSTTTKVPKEVIIVAVALDTADTVTSISDTDSLTWALRGRKSFGTRDVEYWWAYAPSVISSATTITIHLSNSTHGAGAVATFFGCNTSGATPFDAGNAITLPLEVSGTSATMEASATSVATQHEQAIGIVLQLGRQTHFLIGPRLSRTFNRNISRAARRTASVSTWACGRAPIRSLFKDRATAIAAPSLTRLYSQAVRLPSTVAITAIAAAIPIREVQRSRQA